MSSSESSDDKWLQFLPFSSVVETTFWHKLTQLKIDVYALKEEPIEISGYYNNHTAIRLPACFNIDYSSFDKLSAIVKGNFLCHGYLRNTNTKETFTDIDKQVIINEVGKKIWEAITSGRALEDPSLLTPFILLTFADLKKYYFYYWFCFPTLVYPTKVKISEDAQELGNILKENEISQLITAYDTFCTCKSQSAFIVEKTKENFQIHSLDKLKSLSSSDFWLGFADPSSLPTNPGWPLRNILALITYHHPQLVKSGFTVLCWRDITRDGIRKVGQSLVLKLKVLEADIDNSCPVPKCVGWEKNERGKMGPRLVNLSATMDPEKLAESAVDLNLKLMKWRLLPELNLEKIQQTKCLLIGSGTLGCNVARTLMAWGIRQITLIDYGRVAYSNPVRQSLFGFEDCLNGGRAKAECAAESLRKIFPGMMTRGIDLRIPMPGHSVGDAVRQNVEQDVNQLVQLISEHDAIFLLTDTRESRWLPTMLSAFYGKLVINAALGFDTYLVMRHGLRQAWAPDQKMEKPPATLRGALPGRRLGCYFCNDVVAPGDSTKDRTLDQQCTVTRPGISLIASALAVELLVSVLQHPDGGDAAAEISSSAGTADKDSPLGLVPHSLRGFLHRHQLVLPATEAFFNCTACSPLVLERYGNDGFDFLLQVFNNPDCLEEVTGLAELHNDSAAVEVWEYTDEDDED